MSAEAHAEKNRDKTRSAIIFSSTATTVSSGAALGAMDITAAGQKVGAREQDLEGAVYAHIRALRALGRTRINTAEIAQALNLPLKTVERTVGKLTQKGVKIVK